MGAMTKKSWVGAGAIDTSFSYSFCHEFVEEVVRLN